MQTNLKFSEILPEKINSLLLGDYIGTISAFYELQSSFLSGIYKRHKSIETANIIICFEEGMHLAIIRQREKNLNHDVSLSNFWHNIQNVKIPSEKISSIVQTTNIPKETVRRKIKKLLDKGLLLNEKSTKGYVWNLLPKHKDSYSKIINEEINILAKCTYRYVQQLKLNLDKKLIDKELRSQFSFYRYHFLSCQLKWLKMWQNKLKDNELLLIILQAVIPTLQYADKHLDGVNIDNIFRLDEKISDKNNYSKTAISAAAVSNVTGIPRATCIRKLEKLALLGFLLRETKAKLYYVNKNITDRTRGVISKENVAFTLDAFSKYLSIILNSLMFNQK